MKTEIIRHTCDACKKDIDVKKEDLKNPLRELVLPMKHYGEMGFYQKIITDKIEVCEDCLKQIESDLSHYYDMSSVDYMGVQMKRKVVE